MMINRESAPSKLLTIRGNAGESKRLTRSSTKRQYVEAVHWDACIFLAHSVQVSDASYDTGRDYKAEDSDGEQSRSDSVIHGNVLACGSCNALVSGTP